MEHLEPIWFGNVERQWRMDPLFPLICFCVEEEKERKRIVSEEHQEGLKTATKLEEIIDQASDAALRSIRKPAPPLGTYRCWRLAGAMRSTESQEREHSEQWLERRDLECDESNLRSKLELAERGERRFFADLKEHYQEKSKLEIRVRDGTLRLEDPEWLIQLARGHVLARKVFLYDEGTRRESIAEEERKASRSLVKYYDHILHQHYVYVPLS